MITLTMIPWLSRLCRGAQAPKPALTVGVVFLGACLTTLQGRLFSVALTDLRGVFGLDVVEGALLSVAMNGAQLLTMPVTVWLSLVFGPTRVIIVPSLAIGLVALAVPFVRGYEQILVLHVILGLCLGTYLPLTLSLALRNLKPHFWLLAMGVYSLRASFGTDAGLGLSGLYVDVIDWRWVYWTGALVGPLIAFLAWKALPLTPVDHHRLRESDWGGMAMFCLSLILLFAGCSLGELLGWFDSGLVTACLFAGGILLTMSILNLALNKDAFADFAALRNHNVRVALLIACLYGVLMCPTSVLIPNFLTLVGKFKALQIGMATIVVFGAYLAMTPLAAWLARRVDTRLLLISGLSLIVFTSAYCGSSISNEWRIGQYVLALVLLSIGECLTLMGIIPIIIVNLNPAHSVAIGFFAPLARLFAPGVAGGVIALALRVSSDAHGVVLREGVGVGQPLVVQRTAGNSILAIASAIEREAAVLSYVDAFYLVMWIGVAALLLAATLRQAPLNPLTPPRSA